MSSSRGLGSVSDVSGSEQVGATHGGSLHLPLDRRGRAAEQGTIALWFSTSRSTTLIARYRVLLYHVDVQVRVSTRLVLGERYRVLGKTKSLLGADQNGSNDLWAIESWRRLAGTRQCRGMTQLGECVSLRCRAPCVNCHCHRMRCISLPIIIAV